MNPLRYLLPAIYTALTTPEPLTAPVFQHLPAGYGGDAYVLLGQPTAEPTRGSVGCRQWDCTVLLDCVTLFAPGEASSIPADELADAVLSRLEAQALPLGGGLQMGRARLQLLNGADDAFDGKQIDVHRYVRMRFSLSYNSLIPLPNGN